MTGYSKYREWINTSQGNVSRYTLQVGYWISECCKRNKKNPGWALWRAFEPHFPE
jgi:hypothetical protein